MIVDNESAYTPAQQKNFVAFTKGLEDLFEKVDMEKLEVVGLLQLYVVRFSNEILERVREEALQKMLKDAEEQKNQNRNN